MMWVGGGDYQFGDQWQSEAEPHKLCNSGAEKITIVQWCVHVWAKGFYLSLVREMCPNFGLLVYVTEFLFHVNG